MPCSPAIGSPFSSWSTASISASSLKVSTGGPLSRSASERSADSPKAWICRVRETVSGLYWRAITVRTAPESGSTSTRPPLRTRGEPGNVVITRLLGTLRRHPDVARHPTSAGDVARRDVALHPALAPDDVPDPLPALAVVPVADGLAASARLGEVLALARRVRVVVGDHMLVRRRVGAAQELAPRRDGAGEAVAALAGIDHQPAPLLVVLLGGASGLLQPFDCSEVHGVRAGLGLLLLGLGLGLGRRLLLRATLLDRHGPERAATPLLARSGPQDRVAQLQGSRVDRGRVEPENETLPDGDRDGAVLGSDADTVEGRVVPRAADPRGVVGLVERHQPVGDRGAAYRRGGRVARLLAAALRGGEDPVPQILRLARLGRRRLRLTLDAARCGRDAERAHFVDELRVPHRLPLRSARLAGGTRALLLHDVRQLVREELATSARPRRVTPVCKEDVRAVGESDRLERSRRRGGFGPGVNANASEIPPEPSLHRRPDGPVECLTAARPARQSLRAALRTFPVEPGMPAALAATTADRMDRRCRGASAGVNLLDEAGRGHVRDTPGFRGAPRSRAPSSSGSP